VCDSTSPIPSPLSPLFTPPYHQLLPISTRSSSSYSPLPFLSSLPHSNHPSPTYFPLPNLPPTTPSPSIRLTSSTPLTTNYYPPLPHSSSLNSSLPLSSSPPHFYHPSPTYFPLPNLPPTTPSPSLHLTSSTPLTTNYYTPLPHSSSPNSPLPISSSPPHSYHPSPTYFPLSFDIPLHLSPLSSLNLFYTSYHQLTHHTQPTTLFSHLPTHLRITNTLPSLLIYLCPTLLQHTPPSLPPLLSLPHLPHLTPINTHHSSHGTLLSVLYLFTCYQHHCCHSLCTSFHPPSFYTSNSCTFLSYPLLDVVPPNNTRYSPCYFLLYVLYRFLISYTLCCVSLFSHLFPTRLSTHLQPLQPSTLLRRHCSSAVKREFISEMWRHIPWPLSARTRIPVKYVAAAQSRDANGIDSETPSIYSNNKKGRHHNRNEAPRTACLISRRRSRAAKQCPKERASTADCWRPATVNAYFYPRPRPGQPGATCMVSKLYCLVICHLSHPPGSSVGGIEGGTEA